MKSKKLSTTESASRYAALEKMPVKKLLTSINKEDASVPVAIKKSIPKITKLVEAIVQRMKNGGRLFYIGAGTSGRLGILDASEIPPTYGVPFNQVIGIMAGGDKAIRKAVEFAEDSKEQAWLDILAYQPHSNDTIIGIAASGTTPYVIGGLTSANENGLLTGAIVCNENSPVAASAEFPIEVVVGPEFVTGSTRMKSGTAQKLVLNMISTSVMIKLGKVKGNKMVDMQLSNNKLIDRGTKMIMDELKIEEAEALALLTKYGNVRTAISNFKS